MPLALVEPRIVYRPHVPRRIEEVPEEFRGLLRALAQGKERWPLYVWGPPGAGKSCGSLCLVDRVPPIRIYGAVEDYVSWVLAKDWRWSAIEEARLVVVDELAQRSSPTPLEVEVLRRLADWREHRPSIWIGNHPPERIRDAYDDRLYSRVCSGTTYELVGDDRRFA